MSVDRNLLSEFAKITNDTQANTQTQLYGTVVTQGDKKYVKMDGSDIITPIISTTDIKDGERVMVSINNHIATVTGNITNPSAGGDRVSYTEGKVDEFDYLFAGNITAENIAANSITADKILAGSITTDKLMAESIIADKIAADAIESKHIKADAIESKHIKADAIEAEHIKAGAITADKIDAGIITSDHIASGTITADDIATGTITAGSGIIAEGAIGSAQISSLDVAKLESGTIDTSKIYIAGADGHLQLKGNRLQVFDGLGNRAVERVSLGDVNGDGSKFGLRVRGADGETILLDENGVTSEGITDGSITNNKISDDANIDGAKLNINSVVSKINEDGTETIQGTKIEVDGTTLNTKLSTIINKQTEDGERITQAQSQISANTNAIKLKVDEQTYTTDKKDMTSKLEKNTSEISAMKGQIALKVEQTDIENAKSELEGTIDSKINTAKAEIKVTTDAISQNISNLTQTVSTKADGSTVSSLNSKVSSLETSVNGISGKVTSLEKTTTTLGTQVNTANTNASSALNKANNATTTANNAQNTANTNKSNISDLQGEVSTVKNNVASLEVTTSGISQKVSSVESTTATLSGKVNTANNNATNALNKANSANTLADSKAKVFTSTPTVPYKVGDLWVQGTNGDVMKCKTARTSGSYTASDWEKASKYTDDTKANAVDGKVTTLQGTVNTTNSKVATLETNLNGITQRVSSTESTTATLTTKVNKVEGTANTAKSTADSAKTTATNAQNSANSANSKIDNLEIGSTNLILGTKNFIIDNSRAKGWYNQGGFTITQDGDCKIATYNASGLTGNSIKGLYSSYTPCKKGDTFTVSVYIKVENVNNWDEKRPFIVEGYNAANTRIEYVDVHINQNGSNKPTLTNNEWTRFIYTYTITNVDTVSFGIRLSLFRNGKISFKKAQIEKGNKVSDWSIASDDLQFQIDTTTTEISKTKSQVSEIKTNLDGITQRVSSTESTTATLTTKVNTAQSTADAAKTAASNAQNSVNNANNALSINQQTKMNGIELFNNEYKSNTSARPFTNGNYSVVVATEISGANAYESNIIKVTNGQILYTDFIACNINNPYYASIEVYNKDTNNGTNYIQVCYYDKNKTALASNEAALNAISGVTIPSANAWHKLEGWVNVPASNDVRRKAKYVRIRIINRYSGLTGITYWRNISWKQLGSGLLTDTQEVKTEISKTKSQVSEIKTDLNGITSRVGTVESKQTTTDGKITGLETRMTTAESKITETAITNTVKKNFYTKSETNSQITSKGYQTASQVQQTVNGLELKFNESGGYNLLYNSSFKNGFSSWGNNGGTVSIISETSSPTGNSVKVVAGGSGRGIYQHYTPKKTGYYTVSFYGKADANLSFYFGQEGSTTKTVTLTTSWQKFTYTFNRTTLNSNAYVFYPQSAGTFYIHSVLVEGGQLSSNWSPHPSEVYDGITTIDKDGITVSNSNSSTYTQIDSSSFRVENNTGGTVAEFSQNSKIPNLNAGIINANAIYSPNICTKSPMSGSIKYIVNGSTGNDNNNGTTYSTPFKTVTKAVSMLNTQQDRSVDIEIYGSVSGWDVKGINGTGRIGFYFSSDAIINGEVIVGGVNNTIGFYGGSDDKATFKNGISVYRSRDVEFTSLTFRGTNSKGSNIYLEDVTFARIGSCDLGGLSTQLLCAIEAIRSNLWIFNCRGSKITDVVAQSAFSIAYAPRAGTSNVPDYSNAFLCNYDGDNRIHNWSGGNFVKTPSKGWNPAYTPTQRTSTWSFNKIWSDETLKGWSDRQELIQGYASTWNTGRWTGYMQMVDDFSEIRNAISGGTNLSGRIYVQRTSSSGNSTGSKLCLYGSDGTLITNSTSINRGQGVWVSLSSSIIQKIQSGAIKYFYLKADANNASTYFKCERNCKIEITYTK